MNKTFLGILSFVLFFASCATIDTAYINDETNRVPAEELKLEMGYEVYHLRVDLRRNTTTRTTTTTDAQGMTTTTTVVEDVPYHYLGVRFGNGLFLDYNQNLSIDLVEFFNLDNQDFTISQKNKGLLAPKIEYVKTSDDFSREVKSLFGSTTRAKFENNSISIEEGFFKTAVNIDIKENEIQMIPEGVFGFLGKAKIIKNGDNSISFPGFWYDSVFTQVDENHVKMDDYFHVFNQGNNITIQYKGLFGITTEFTFARMNNGFLFYDKNYRGVKVEMNGNTITVVQNTTELFTASVR